MAEVRTAANRRDVRLLLSREEAVVCCRNVCSRGQHRCKL